MKISDIPRPDLRNLFAETPARPASSRGFDAMLSSRLGQGKEPRESPVLLGTITRDTPTVSQLLYQKGLKSQCWQIIHDKVNADKAFHRIQPGTQIHYDPATRELLWGKEADTALAKSRQPAPEAIQAHTPARQQTGGTPAQAVAEAVDKDRTGNTPIDIPARAGADLAELTKQFIGTDYNRMDCYELLVGGLTEMGIQYQGKGGLHEHLVNRARQQGLARNHYLNGEGLVSASGTDVYKKTFYRVSDPMEQADAVMSDLQDRLSPGQILSFSMRNRGHTGIISSKAGQWAFINSGKMDNNLSGDNGTKAVGEERLKDELLNWFKLAETEGEALQITLGRLDMDRLSMFAPNRIRQKV